MAKKIKRQINQYQYYTKHNNENLKTGQNESKKIQE